VVVIATYSNRERAQRMCDWLLRSHITAHLRRGDDGSIRPEVAAHEEHRAVDLLFTLVIGLDADRLTPQPAWRRPLIAESALSGGVAALLAFLAGLAAIIALPFVPVWVLGLLVLVAFAVVAALPGGTDGPRPVHPRRVRRARWHTPR
jgi:hypothetical protein